MRVAVRIAAPSVTGAKGAPRRAVTLGVTLSLDPAVRDGAGAPPDAASSPDASSGGVRIDEPGAEEPPGSRPRAPWLPDERFVRTWARRAVDAMLDGTVGATDPRLAGDGPLELELSVHLADEPASRALNREHRGRDRATNVLSFGSGLPALGPGDGAGPALVALGDLVACPPVIRREAAEQNKPESDHWAHLVVHGTLHLFGLDHEDEVSAALMEAAEIRLLSSGGLPDPYGAAPDEAER